MCSISRPFSARQAKKLAVQTARRVDTKDPTEPCVNREAMPQSVQNLHATRHVELAIGQ